MLTLNSTTFPIRKKYLIFNLLRRTNSPTRQCQCSGMSNQPHPNSTIALSQKQYNRHNRHPLTWIPANLWNDLWPHAPCACVCLCALKHKKDDLHLGGVWVCVCRRPQRISDAQTLIHFDWIFNEIFGLTNDLFFFSYKIIMLEI